MSRLIGLIAALVVALAPAASYLVIHFTSAATELENRVEVTARALSEHVVENAATWQLQERKLRFLIDPASTDRSTDRIELRDRRTGELLAEVGAAPADPSVAREAYVFDAGSPVATLVRSRSLRPGLLGALPWALLGLLLGSAAYYFLRVLPLRDAARAHAELARAADALHEEKERAQVTLMSIGDAVITTDVAGRVATINPVAATLLAMTAEQARGRRSRR